MVLVASGPHGSGNASGSIGADTYSHNRFGQYVRNRTKPVNPNTARQQGIRGALAFLTDAWSRILNQGNRDKWEAYGEGVVMKNRLGEDMTLTGFNHFLRSNTIVHAHIGPYTVDGPGIFELPAQDDTLSITASAAAGQITLTFNDAMAWANEALGYMSIFQGKPQNAQRNFFGGPWRYIGFFAGQADGAPASPLPVNVSWAMTQGQRQWIYCRIHRADGRLSAPFRSDILVGA